mgnify:FL=1
MFLTHCLSINQRFVLHQLSTAFFAPFWRQRLIQASCLSICAIVLSTPPVLAASMPEKSASAILAQTRPQCAPEWITTPKALPDEQAPHRIQADQLNQPTTLTYTLSGHIQWSQPGLVVLSDQAWWHRTQQKARLWGQVELHQTQLMATAEQLWLDQSRGQNQTQATLDQVRFQLTDSRAHGHAHQLRLDQGAEQAWLHDAALTTCRLETHWLSALRGEAEPSYDWQLSFSEMEINQAKRRIYGQDVWLHFQQLPVFYSPYLNFPMDERASGFLFPQLGSVKSLSSDRQHSYLSVPYYFNLAPHYDNTLTLTAMQSRGLILDNAFRYQQPTHQGELTVSGAQDGLADTLPERPQQRWRVHFKGQQQWHPQVHSQLDWHLLSDDFLYADLPLDRRYDTASYLQRSAQVHLNQGDFSAQMRVQSPLRLRDSRLFHYAKQPEIALQYRPTLPVSALPGLSIDLAANTTEFVLDRPDPVTPTSAPLSLPEGTRHHLSPAIRYEAYAPYGYFKAEARWHHLEYQLKEGMRGDTPSAMRTHIGQYALRGHLLFERTFSALDQRWVQTLKPEIQYLYVPFVEQAHQPLFDTGYRSLDFSNLFAYNRFVGADRIGDTHQITTALRTEWLSPRGQRIAHAGLGQIHYLQDRQVQLTETPQARAQNQVTASDYYVQLGLETPQWHFATTLQVDRKEATLNHSNSRLRYQSGPSFQLLMAHTRSDTQTFNPLTHSTTQLDPQATAPAASYETWVAGAYWHLNDRWSLGGYVNYDFALERARESRYSLRYNDCCWGSEISIKQTQLDNGLYNYSIMYLIELKGLSSVGTAFDQFLEDRLAF